ncbi:hypothetical protein ACFLU8_04030 [Chloroflexota bacterium]
MEDYTCRIEGEEEPITPGNTVGSDTVGGEVYPMNKVSLITPWIALVVFILAGGIFLIRRRVHS